MTGWLTGMLAARQRRHGDLQLNAGRPVEIRQMIANGQGMSSGDVAVFRVNPMA